MLYTSGEFPAFFRFLSNPADLAFLSEGRIHDREVYDRVYLVVLYASGALYPSVRRIFAGYFRPPSLISGGLFHFHHHIWRIHGSHGTYPLYRLTRRTRFRLRHGDGVGQYDRDRHPALFPARRGDRLLRAGKQYGYEFRADDRAVHAHQLLLRNDFRLLVAIRKPWFYHGLYGQDSL